MKARGWIAFSGFVWFVMGFFLLMQGFRFLTQMALRIEMAVFLIALGLLVGFLKGRYVLSKSARRVIQRIIHLSPPIHWKNVYAPSYWLLIGAMMGLGMILKWVPLEVRGTIDVAIGFALLNGSLLYFRATYDCHILGS